MSTVVAQLTAFARTRPLVAFCVTLTVLLAAVNYFLWQQRTAITAQNDDVRQKGDAILNALVARQHVTSDLARLKEALEVVDRNLVIESDMEVNLGYFYKLEKLSGIRLSQLNQLAAPPPPEGGPYKTIPVSIRATGTYTQLMNFVYQLETGPRILAIRAFNFGRGDPKTNQLTLDLTVALLARP